MDKFIDTVARLRAPDGCPWDREQTHKSLARYLLEEAYEVLDAIHGGDPDRLKEELGDLLLQVMLNSQIAKDAGKFDIEDVACGINEKMIRRHPHVFGDIRVSDAKDVVAQWEHLKEEELSDSSAIDSVCRVLPALLQALKVSEKAASQGFEWNNEGEVWEKLWSELNELKQAIADPNMTNQPNFLKAGREVELELGDVLFTIVNIARWHALNPEESLILAIGKFKCRFRIMEKLSERSLKDLSKSELDELWTKAKALD